MKEQSKKNAQGKGNKESFPTFDELKTQWNRICTKKTKSGRT